MELFLNPKINFHWQRRALQLVLQGSTFQESKWFASLCIHFRCSRCDRSDKFINRCGYALLPPLFLLITIHVTSSTLFSQHYPLTQLRTKVTKIFLLFYLKFDHILMYLLLELRWEDGYLPTELLQVLDRKTTISSSLLSR